MVSLSTHIVFEADTRVWKTWLDTAGLRAGDRPFSAVWKFEVSKTDHIAGGIGADH
jgi:hypothetical protein